MKRDQRLSAARSGMLGFTLVEVLVALLVLSFVLVALVKTAGSQARNFGELRDRSYADWVAANVLVEERLRARLPALGRRDGRALMAGQSWRYEVVVQATEEPSIRRIDVRVFRETEPGAALLQLTGFAGEALMP